MDSQLCSLVFAVLYVCAAGLSANSQQSYYIVPLSNISCSHDPCLTLSQLAAHFSNYSRQNASVSISISLLFLSGNHSLDQVLSLSFANNLSMTEKSQNYGSVFIKCRSRSDRFVVSDTTFALIKGLKFVGCGNSAFMNVEEFIVQDCIFLSLEGEGRGTAIVLNAVVAANIVNCSFISNVPANDSDIQSNIEFISGEGPEENDGSVAIGGALFATFSDVKITNCKFVDNAAVLGGALFVLHSHVHISGSSYSHNRAERGGVIAAFESSVNINDSIFSKNVAGMFGGVILTDENIFDSTGLININNTAVMRGSFVISNSTFTANSAAVLGGVMYTFRESLVTVYSSEFANNSAASGGVMCTLGGSFTFIGSSFTNNRAADYGGVLDTVDGQFNIISSVFTHNNAAVQGGVLRSSGVSSFTINSSTFSNNSAAHDGGVMSTFYGEYSFYIVDSTFSNNSAYAGGVMDVLGGYFNISSSTFVNNRAHNIGGVMRSFRIRSFSFTGSIFFNNSAADSGGVMCVNDVLSSFLVTNSTFTHNTASTGGVMDIVDGVFHVANSSFAKNSAHFGGVVFTFEGSFTFIMSNFTNNRAADFGGVMYVDEYSDSSVNIVSSTFINNSVALNGGVIYVSMRVLDENSITYNDTADGMFNLISSSFISNSAARDGGVVYIDIPYDIGGEFLFNSSARSDGVAYVFNGLFSFTDSTFFNNSAGDRGGVLSVHGEPNSATVNNNTVTYASRSGKSLVSIENSSFTGNSAIYGGVMNIPQAEYSFNVTKSTFTSNTAYTGGVVASYYSNRSFIDGCTFTNNSATFAGGVIWCMQGSLTITNSRFNINSARVYGGIIFSVETSTRVADSTFSHNSGSLYSFNSNLSLSGNTVFENCTEPSDKATVDIRTSQEGGAITTFQSTVTFTGESSFESNQAQQGGAILAMESRLTFYGKAFVMNNNATKNSGGGISLINSELEIKGNCTFSGNHATRGGGVHAKSSTVTVFQPGTLQFTSNSAENGSGVYLEVNPALYIVKNTPQHYFLNELLIFTGNHARYGGTMYVADDTNSGACPLNVACFIQTLALYQTLVLPDYLIVQDILFYGNTATEHGANLFGGLLDRCVPSPFAEVYVKDTTVTQHLFSGVSYLRSLSNIALDSIASLPLRICFCSRKSEPDCSYQPPPISVKKGETFTVSLVAVDQVNRTVEASIISSLASPDGGFGEGQQTQSVQKNCSDVTFSVFSPHDHESINLFANGPCGNFGPFIRKLDIQFLNCTCPVGFQPSNAESTRCECVCDSALLLYTTNCNLITESLIRENTNSWIAYINDTDPPGFVIHPNCPKDYCQPQTVNVSINLNLPNGADSQCAYNRTGTLCGACQEHLSLSLGSSRCLPCPSHWPAVFVVILLAAIIAGILLVAALLALNMTVAVGLINCFIFYANIVAANSAVFFPSSEPSFPTVFVAWLNLDIGLDVCFINGLDMYAKTWLQLVFPVYIISLVVLVILACQYSTRFAALIGRRDPVATLATLILLSYAKLLSVTITVLSYSVINYPDGSHETVWLPDGNVKYFQGKHAALVIVVLFVIILGVPYTLLLLLWQWLVRAPRWNVFKWTRNSKLNLFITTYHVPYNSKYRYWTGLLLLVRVILYITASATTSVNSQVSLLVTMIFIGNIVFLSRAVGKRVYKDSFVDIIDTVVCFNILALAAFSSYNFKSDPTKQVAVAYTSTIITCQILIGVIAYHVYFLVRKERTTAGLNEYPLAPVQPAETKVTRSIVEVHKPQCQPLETDSDKGETFKNVQCDLGIYMYTREL